MKVENINRETATVVLTKGELYNLAHLLNGEAIKEEARGIHKDYARTQCKKAIAFYKITDKMKVLENKPCVVRQIDDSLSGEFNREDKTVVLHFNGKELASLLTYIDWEHGADNKAFFDLPLLQVGESLREQHYVLSNRDNLVFVEEGGD